MRRGGLVVGCAAAIALSCGGAEPEPPSREVILTVATDRAVAEVDPRFLSVAVDAGQVVGGAFWNPSGEVETGAGTLEGEPYDFSRPKLRALARELAPAYLRIGGSEADRVHYDMTGGPPAEPPAPFTSTLTRAEWDGVGAFARALDFPILFTLNAGPGVRGPDLAWKADEARTLLTYTRDHGYPVVLWELGNEINGFPVIHGLDFQISGEQVARDLVTLRALRDELTPGVKLGAPSSAFWPIAGEFVPIIEQMLAAGGGQSLDVLTWHYYPMQSRRCPVALRRAEPDLVFDPTVLDEIDRWADVVEGARDAHAPGLPVWLGETGGAQCGGEPDLSDAFAGGFWWIDELGKVARRGQKVLVRQTLSGSNYGLLDDATLEPRPDYWTSVLHKRLMGARVLDAASNDPMLRAYAQCTKGEPGAVTLAVANLDEERAAKLALDAKGATEARVYELSAASRDAKVVRLNGAELRAGEDGALPPLEPRRVAVTDGQVRVTFPAATYGFVVVGGDVAAACR